LIKLFKRVRWFIALCWLWALAVSIGLWTDVFLICRRLGVWML